MLSSQIYKCRIRPPFRLALPRVPTATATNSPFLGREPPPSSSFARHHAQARQFHLDGHQKAVVAPSTRQELGRTETHQHQIRPEPIDEEFLVDHRTEEPDDEAAGREAWELRQLEDEHASVWHHTSSKDELRQIQTMRDAGVSSAHAYGEEDEDEEHLFLRTLTPSGSLTEALRDAGHHSCLPVERHGKQDLSYRSPRAQYPPSKRLWAYVPSGLLSLQSILAQYIRATPVTGTGRGLTARGREQREDYEEQLAETFSQRNMQYLQKRHFDVEDVVSWAWIVTAPTADLAATRLLILSNYTSDPTRYRRNKAPVFLVMFLLRRADITRSAFRLLLTQSYNMLQNIRHQHWTYDFTDENMHIHPQQHHHEKAPWLSQMKGAGNHQELDTETLARLHVRLLRHARLQWPEAVPSVVAAVCRFGEVAANVERQDPATLARLTFLYNRMLTLAGMPAPKAPFSTVYISQRAQFALLKHMNEFEPPLLINREGYRAVVRVQLRHRKTRREREWALLKSKAWPPWKEDRYGLDADKGVEYGISGAKQALRRAQEAGYLPQTWEQVASILSGWDTDESPTIQTRAIHPGGINDSDGTNGSGVSIRKVYNRSSSRVDAFQIRSEHGKKSPNLSRSIGRVGVVKTDEAMENDMLWAVRIQATRTLDEAWYCFLAYRDNRDSWDPTVCFAMFKKLVLARLSRVRRDKQAKEGMNPAHKESYQQQERQHQYQHQNQQQWYGDEVTPGDTQEIWPTSENPRERPYLTEAIPPDEHVFMSDVLNHGVRPGGRFLAYALAHAESLGVGWQYIQNSNLSERAIGMLVAQQSIDARVLRTEVRLDVFAAFIRLLCRASRGMKVGKWRPLMPKFRHLSYGHGVTHHNPLLQAHRLLHASRTSYRPPWYDLLSALAARGALMPRFGSSSPYLEASMHNIAAWDAIEDALLDMRDNNVDLDFEGFHIACVGLEKAITAAHNIKARHDTTAAPNHVSREHSQFGPSPERDRQSARMAERERQYMERVLQSGSAELKRLFTRIAPGRAAAGWIPEDIDSAFATATFRYVGGSADSKTRKREKQQETAEPRQTIGAVFLLPRLLDVPKAADLHAFIRVLGLADDRQAIVDLLRWMAWFAPEITVKSNEMRNGQRMMRRALTCARVMLERWWEVSIATPTEAENGSQATTPDLSDSLDSKADPLLHEAKEIFETVEEWGEWPTDEECEQYISIGRFV